MLLKGFHQLLLSAKDSEHLRKTNVHFCSGEKGLDGSPGTSPSSIVYIAVIGEVGGPFLGHCEPSLMILIGLFDGNLQIAFLFGQLVEFFEHIPIIEIKYLYMKQLMKFIVLLIALIAVSISAPSYGFGLSATNSVASATTSYTFGISLIADSSNIINIQSGASSTIQFPSDYTGRLTSGAVSCTLLNWGDPFASNLPTPTCSISGTSLTITNLFTSAYTINYPFEYSIQVASIKNPLASGLTGTFYYYLYATAGTILITATGVGISTASMTCSASSSPTAVNSNGSLAVQFTTPEFQTTSSIQIDFGIYWP